MLPLRTEGRRRVGEERLEAHLRQSPGKGRDTGQAGRWAKISLVSRRREISALPKANSFFFLIFPPGPFWSLLTFYLFFTSLHCFSVLHFIRFVSGPEHTPAKWPTKQGPGSER